nr:MAG TPA: hypothetical protein [Caudoviricetes sp.]
MRKRPESPTVSCDFGGSKYYRYTTTHLKTCKNMGIYSPITSNISHSAEPLK